MASSISDDELDEVPIEIPINPIVKSARDPNPLTTDPLETSSPAAVVSQSLLNVVRGIIPVPQETAQKTSVPLGPQLPAKYVNMSFVDFTKQQKQGHAGMALEKGP